MEMTFSVNDSPFAGREGKFVTSRQIRDRLFRETLKDVSLRVTEMGTTDSFNVAGRGEMSLSILIETMRREGYEFQVSPPRVLYQDIDGKKCEPIERLVVDVPQECVGSVIEKIGSRKGEMLEMTPVGSRIKVEFLVPSRGLFGYRNEFLTDTKGEGIMASIFEKYEPFKGDIARRNTGSLIAFEAGDSVTYGLYAAQERGQLFIGAGVPVYGGMKEFDLIEFLMKNPGKVYSREQLLDLVWGYDYQGDIRTVDVHIRRLREKLEKDPAKPEYIVTKWGIGYYFAD